MWCGVIIDIPYRGVLLVIKYSINCKEEIMVHMQVDNNVYWVYFAGESLCELPESRFCQEKFGKL